jgi:hypothetical protein
VVSSRRLILKVVFKLVSIIDEAASRIAFNNAHHTTKMLRCKYGTIARSGGVKMISAKPHPSEIERGRTTGRNLIRDLAGEYAKRALAKAARASISWHNDILALSESIIVKHAAELINRRRHLTSNSKHGPDDSRWLQEVECFIDEVKEVSGVDAQSSPELWRAVRWMIAGATAQLAVTTAPASLDRQNAIRGNAA